jgi:hypothetical protein
MAKKKGGDATSKKTEQKKKQSIIEDKTFGLKNKNKSKKVQQKIHSIEVSFTKTNITIEKRGKETGLERENRSYCLSFSFGALSLYLYLLLFHRQKNVMNSGDPRQRKLEEQRAKAKAERKLRAKAAKAEQEALFGEALLAVSKKKTLNQKEGKVESQGRDGGVDESNKKGTSRAMKMMYMMDAQEMEEKLREDPSYVPTLEDEIEMQRQKKVAELKKAGKGTPVTPETFAAWQTRKRQQRTEAARKKVEAEFKKKKGGKGLAVLSGRDLYEYKKELFADRDDNDADGDSDNDDGGNNNDGSNNNHNNSNKATTEQDETAAAPSGVSDTTDVHQVAAKVQSDLFLEGDDDDLDDLEDD